MADPMKLIEDDSYVDVVQSLLSKIKTNMGLNHRDPLLAHMTHFNTKSPLLGVDPARPYKSYVFFTRPDCNLQYMDNFQNSPELQYYGNTELGLALLDLLQYPDKGHVVAGMTIPKRNQVKSNLIPILSNACYETSGGKDLTMDKVDSKADFAGNFTTMANGADGIFGPGEISLGFNNPIGSPILHLFIAWFMYIHHACKGSISPETKYIIERRLDYTSSIYVFLLGPDNTIERFAKYTGCFPISVPFGEIQHNNELPPDMLSKINVTMAYNKYEPMNPDVFRDFNYVTMSNVLKDPSLLTLGHVNNLTPQMVRTNILPPADLPDNGSAAALAVRYALYGGKGGINNYASYTDIYEQPVMSESPFIVGNKLMFLGGM